MQEGEEGGRPERGDGAEQEEPAERAPGRAEDKGAGRDHDEEDGDAHDPAAGDAGADELDRPERRRQHAPELAVLALGDDVAHQRLDDEQQEHDGHAGEDGREQVRLGEARPAPRGLGLLRLQTEDQGVQVCPGGDDLLLGLAELRAELIPGEALDGPVEHGPDAPDLLGERLDDARQHDRHGVHELLDDIGQELLGRVLDDEEGHGLRVQQVKGETLGDDDHGRGLAASHPLPAVGLVGHGDPEHLLHLVDVERAGEELRSQALVVVDEEDRDGRELAALGLGREDDADEAGHA